MQDISLTFILALGGTFFLAGLVKGVTGMGLPTVAMGLLGTFMPPVTAAGLLILPSFVTNIWQLLTGPSFLPLLRRLWPMMVAIVIGTVFGSFMLTGGTGGWATPSLGAALVVYAAYTLLARPFSVSKKLEKILSPVIGLTTGFITGGTGVFVIPAVPYLQSLGLDRDNLVQALGLSFTVSTIALAVGLVWHGAFQPGNIGLSALALIPALGGMWAGTMIRRIVSPATFRRWFLISLILLGSELFLRPWL